MLKSQETLAMEELRLFGGEKKLISTGDINVFNHLKDYHAEGLPICLSVKNLPANSGDMGSENTLEEEMATHFSILAWEIPWTEEPGGL